MVIKFICPNGHPLSAPDDRAGKTGKCPKCETAFVVPGLDEFGDEGPQGEATAASDSGPSSAQASDAKDDVIVFLCPNGHKLNGPASLKGRPGKCPHCGAKFVIPGDDDEEEPTESAEASQEFAADAAATAQAPSPAGYPPTGPAPTGAFPPAMSGIASPPPPPPPPGTQSPSGIPFSSERPVVGTAVDENFELIEEVPVVEVIEDVLLEGGHPLAAIVARFCDGDTGSWQLNIGLKDGTSFQATRFSRQLSLGHYAVFAQPTVDHESGENGREVVTIVAWETIGRIDVRRTPVESDPLFE